MIHGRNMKLEVRNNRVIIYDHQIPQGVDMRRIPGGRYYKTLQGYSYPVARLSDLQELLAQHLSYPLDKRWYNLFPEYQYLQSEKNR